MKKELRESTVLWKKWVLLWCCCIWMLDCMWQVQCTVTYDSKAIVIDGKRRILISGSIHYPRSTPEMWEDLIQKAKDGGLDVIQTYVFWNLHEPSPNQYNFKGSNDLVRFLKTVHKAGLYAHLRIGPYVCAEWNFGGFPVWLKYVPGISFRTDNEPFKRAMQGFTQKIVNLMKTESLYQHQGGPIILSQIENEYGVLSDKYGTAGKQYMHWAANMALNLDTGVPWVMCKEVDAPDYMINTCNGFYCDAFKPNSPNKPKMWTEAWTSWFSEFGYPTPQRPLQDLAYAVAKFIQKGGSLVNYYMYHGGTNFGRTAGGPFITTSYDYDAPIDEYGMLREPKSGHLKELHYAVKQCEEALVADESEVTELGKFQQAYIFRGFTNSCAFLSNNDDKAVKVLFNNMHYSLPAKSISILLDCKHVLFNTAKVRVQTSQVEMIPTNEQFAWEAYNEDLTSLGSSSAFPAFGLLEQISVTRDTTDYLWYTIIVYINPSESFLKLGNKLTLNVQSTGHLMYAYVNQQYQGFASGMRQNPKVSYVEKVTLQAGQNTISLLSVAVGLPNIGPHFEQRTTGLNRVTLNGLDGGRRDLTRSTWNYQVGLKGESMNLAYPYAFSAVDWTQSSLQAHSSNHPLTWYKAYFQEPEGVEPLALDMISMSKGQVWVNGNSIGRYWSKIANGTCTKGCSYVKNFRPSKCLVGCDQPTQRYYHVPRSFLRPTGNLVVVIEELGGDISGIRLVKRLVTSVCATVAEYHPNYFKNLETENYGDNEKKKFRSAKLRLKCDGQDVITAIKFASFGTPQGKCGSLKQGPCHAAASRNISEQTCIGQKMCSLVISTNKFGDPCTNELKRLSVEAVCSSSD